MHKKSVIILGDSTSMSVGADGVSYPFLLSKAPIWGNNTNIVNCSIPGFTSADLCSFFFDNINTFGEIVAVIIYTGNCDTMSSELPRPRYSFWYQVKRRIVQRYSISKPLRLKNKLLHFKWHNNFNLSIEKATRVEDFSFNLERVIKYCNKHAINTIIINPVAHKHFPTGIGNGNFMFYHYYDINDKSSEIMDIDDRRFIEAYQYFEDKEFLKAADLYREILLNPECLSSNLEYQTLIVNNYAVCQAKLSNFEEAEYLLEIIREELNARVEIIMYNLALIAKAKGQYQKYNVQLEQAYENDKFMYRIRNPYRDVLNNLATRYRLPLLDVGDITTDESFVDHCHLLPEFHQKISNFIVKELQNFGEHLAFIDNQLYNPEYALGNDQEFKDYFKIFSDLNLKDISDQISLIQNCTLTDIQKHSQLSQDIKNTIQYTQKHPLFNKVENILLANPCCPSDVGRFSEFFTIRFLVPYVKYIENSKDLGRVFHAMEGLLKTSEQLGRILPEESHQYIDGNILSLSSEQGHSWIKSILSTCCEQLNNHLSKGSQIDNRLKTTIFWYFREVLRFGSHSRVSMRYERVVLERIVEALAVASVINEGLIDREYSEEIKSLLDFTKETTNIHERYTEQYQPTKDNTSLVLEYNSELNTFFKKIQNNIC
jgi:hypothetical protein